MRTYILVFVSAVVITVTLPEDVHNSSRELHLRNFYKNDNEHAKQIEFFSQFKDNHKIRHKHNISRKLTKLKRCRRYAQIYYQNYVPPSCYYPLCRQNYCGYCPTSTCRRRCDCTIQPVTKVTTTATTARIKGFYFFIFIHIKLTTFNSLRFIVIH